MKEFRTWYQLRLDPPSPIQNSLVRHRKGPGYLYLGEFEDSLFKVGATVNPYQRFSDPMSGWRDGEFRTDRGWKPILGITLNPIEDVFQVENRIHRILFPFCLRRLRHRAMGQKEVYELPDSIAAHLKAAIRNPSDLFLKSLTAAVEAEIVANAAAGKEAA